MSPLLRLFPSRLAVSAAVTLILICTSTAVLAESGYYSAECSRGSGKPWGICKRDGGNRPTEPYLSSLVGGEQQTGAIGSPPFKLSVDRIRFTIRGHDGQGGGRNQNYAALIDNKTGKILRKTPAPGNDALQACEWDVADLKERTVRFQLVDGNADGAYAWLGVEKIEAGPELTIDFRKGMPKNWDTTTGAKDQTARRSTIITSGPVPFREFQDAFTWIPDRGAGLVSVGCEVERIYLLGCTLPAGRVLETYGYVDLVYADKSKDTYPLVLGFTLEGSYKTPTKSDAAHVLPVGDGTRYLAAIQPRKQKLMRIVLRRGAAELPRPRISAITCKLAATTKAPKTLQPLDSVKATPADDKWLASHTLSPDGPTALKLADQIRRDHGVPVTLEEIQRLEEPGGARFMRKKIADRPFEAASVCDVDGDGQKDIVSGEYWYAGPDFAKSFKFRTILAQSGYHDSFHDYPMDVNGDGKMDIVSGGWFGKTLYWRENPGNARTAGEWPCHEIDKPGSIETSRFWDVDKDGHVEVVPNAGGNVVFYRLGLDASGKGTGKFEKHVVKMGGCGHGLGFGDINGDNRGDFVIPDGWLEAPADPLKGEWKLHGGFNLPRASVPILVHDVNEDGKADIIYGNAHGYGLFWVQQHVDGDGKRTWTKHLIDDQSAQYHDMQLADIDGDGRVELVTGKRYYAHNGHDAGAEDPVFVRYFDFDKKGNFAPHTIDYGSSKQASAVGIYFWVEDVTGDGRLDIIAPGKEGLYLFERK
ncbi:MAG: VCBS repeat-containing protein [Pirellulales bacterium]|nr:VCBS repeat-containing protein [Pirellulales bacterium]